MTQQTSTIRVLVADDHPVLREGLTQLLSGQADIEVVGEAGSGRDAVRKAQELNPDVVIMDISMPGMNGIQAARRLRTAAGDARVVILTVHQEEEYVYEALKAGASGYVLKDAPVEQLVSAIHAAAAGKTYLSPEVDRLVVRATGDDDIRTLSQHLTNREREVCRLLARGNTVPEIAAMIGISRKTVDVHKTRLMKKLCVHNRAELVTYAIKNKLVEV